MIKLPSLDEILKKLEDKYDPSEQQDLEPIIRRINSQIILGLDCLIKSEYGKDGNGKIQVIPNSTVICSYYGTYDHSCVFINGGHLCPFYEKFVKK